MNAGQIAEKLMQHPDADVMLSFDDSSGAGVDAVEYIEGQDYYIIAAD